MTARCLAALVLSLLAVPASAATMCHTAGASGNGLATSTAEASATFLAATSEALLAVRALEQSGNGFAGHRERATALLDAAIAGYRQALRLSEDLDRADRFLKERPFERLRTTLGITSGTLNSVRWEALARTARESRTPATDLITVCVAGAASLKAALTSVGPATPPAMLRRTVYAWSLVLAHGGLVSDAFDASIR